MDDAIKLLNENKQHRILLGFGHNMGRPNILKTLYDENGRHHSFTSINELRHVDKWNLLGAAIGRNTSLRILELALLPGGTSGYRRNNVNNESYQCMEVMYRGLEMNRSIENLDVSMGLLSDDGGTLPSLNLHDVQFKTGLKKFVVRGTINEDQSHMISSFFENFSLESFDMGMSAAEKIPNQLSGGLFWPVERCRRFVCVVNIPLNMLQ